MNKNFTKNIFLILSLGVIPLHSNAQNQTELWGMTTAGGNSAGVIFKTDANGDDLEVMHKFLEHPGINPQASLCKASNGKLYGTTWLGGLENAGLIFEYDPVTNIYKKIIDFTGINTGNNPAGSLIKASNGKLYGMTSSGGINNMGVIFEFNPADHSFIKKFDFDGASHGSNPLGSLTEVSDGILYAMTWRGGSNDQGVIVEFNLSTGICEKKFDFDGGASGSGPQGSLVKGANGKLYGTTYEGGNNNAGVLFGYDYASDVYTKLHDFIWSKTGASPLEGLIQYGNGSLYGTTNEGGVNDHGVFFEYVIAEDTLIKKFDFDAASTGRGNIGRLMLSSDGKIWGMTIGGGAYGAGIIYEYDISGSVFNKRYDFKWDIGANPRGGLVQADNGKLYGMTYAGGETGQGSLFEFDTLSNVYTSKINLNGTKNGRNIYGSLIDDSTGNLYGLTCNGGLNNMGVLFKFDRTNNVYKKIFDFAGSETGSYPRGSLMQAVDGKFYGTTGNGGLGDLGVIFAFDPVLSEYSKKYDFTGDVNGRTPAGKLVQTDGGKLYGVTISGGTYDYGVIFEYDLSDNTFSKKHDFDGSISGSYPYNGMIRASDGKLYGLTSQGGINNMGVLYEFDPVTGNCTNKFNFNGSLGKKPYGTLMEASNGKLYGMTREGGTFDMGVLFEYDFTADTLIKEIDFNGTDNGRWPQGNLIQASNGFLYGMVSFGGITDDGIIFEYDPVSKSFNKKMDFNGLNGEYPTFNEVIEICTHPKISSFDSSATICAGFGTDFHVTAAGNGLSFQWQVNEGPGFTDIFDSQVYTGVTNDTLHIASTTSGMNTFRYRCVITSSCPEISIISDTAILNVNSAFSISESDSICHGQTFNWHGQHLTAGGMYYDNKTSINGCDSIYALALSVNPVYAFSEEYSICNGETYTWHGINCKNPDIYIAKYASIKGCDSIYVLNLTVNTVDVSVIQNANTLTAGVSGAGYQWLNCSDHYSILPDETNQDFYPVASGLYAVEITQNNCVDTSDYFTITITGVDKQEFIEIKLYPNPVTDDLIIEAPEKNEWYGIEMMNAFGQVVYQNKFRNKTTVPASHLAPGVYMIKIENRNTFTVRKIIKQ